jgi:phospholipid/cholesterol/gamma-HCH transport system permease protein
MALGAVNEAGAIGLFVASMLRSMLRRGGKGQYIQQCAFVGADSLPIILLTSFFTGAVLALQSYNGLNGGALANTQLGRLVVISMLRELGPVLASLMLASRVGAAMAAELGTMRVTEQIDALTTLATNPMRYLVVPRVLACLTMLPLLVILGNSMGILGGYVVGTGVLGIPEHQYLESTFMAISTEDQVMALVKAAVFGLIVGLMGTYHGFNAKNGAAGVGQATTQAVVYAAVGILVADYMITALFV